MPTLMPRGPVYVNMLAASPGLPWLTLPPYILNTVSAHCTPSSRVGTTMMAWWGEVGQDTRVGVAGLFLGLADKGAEV